MGFEPVLFVRPPLRLAWIERSSSYRSVSFFPLVLPPVSVNHHVVEVSDDVVGEMGRQGDRPGCAPRFLCGRDLRGREGPLGGRVPSTPEGLRLLADSLLATDRVALEVTASCWEVAKILEPFVDRVIVVSPDDTGIASARAKTDKLDARTLAGLCWKGELEAVWMPDQRCHILRRRLARRTQLVHARSRAKNEISAVLQRRLSSGHRSRTCSA